MKFLVVALPYFPAVRPNTSLNTPVSHTLDLCSSENRQTTQHNTASTTVAVAAALLTQQQCSSHFEHSAQTTCLLHSQHFRSNGRGEGVRHAVSSDAKSQNEPHDEAGDNDP